MKCLKKLLMIKFEDLHFEPVINLQITTLLVHAFLLECYSYNISDEWKFGKKTHSPTNMDKTYEYTKISNKILTVKLK